MLQMVQMVFVCNAMKVVPNVLIKEQIIAFIAAVAINLIRLRTETTLSSATNAIQLVKDALTKATTTASAVPPIIRMFRGFAYQNAILLA